MVTWIYVAQHQVWVHCKRGLLRAALEQAGCYVFSDPKFDNNEGKGKKQEARQRSKAKARRTRSQPVQPLPRQVKQCSLFQAARTRRQPLPSKGLAKAKAKARRTIQKL